MEKLEGKQAPAFSLANENGEMVSLNQFKGKNYVVLYFYPKDSTPGCTTEACDFRDAQADFEGLNAVVLGVSPDHATSHQKFIEKHGLPFSLLVDEDHAVAEQYGVWKLKKNFGKEYMGIERSTFLIDPTGTVVKEWRKVRVKGHVEDALATLEQLTN
ncbi:thioredoxin-dependent thiol peroxidase [Sporosarcina sp. P21c]|uniref:thioredoxin-dependent thiol peroxidase n=1 Tax=unclassified Sporosarcina TaxID=2647733 RepID=UPI000C16EFBC|nr:MULTISPECIES: thioredoxin-dependent thiol peroxidase [unclassified Sporosarcina]PIC65997.1 thioredoxin-dependent thiol peroxidase [Sporosarcina sp. P16a]PIC81971.1 thioredoxin-dependent thiol peroxidase [Sporosarcina sp. P1]PIC88334.1 thioredoxin-dependent thiol peroxidase [Sporosarcina sp. P21c]PIC91537.1 thioredoxin-dependent thiol peroxidase [Sporosarcina sp. P25]